MDLDWRLVCEVWGDEKCEDLGRHVLSAMQEAVYCDINDLGK